MDMAFDEDEVIQLQHNFFDSKPFKLKILKIKLTNACNSKCQFCGYWKSKNPKFLQKKTIFHVLNEAKKMGVEKITLSGGEPLLHPDIEAIIKKAFSKQFKVTLITNGLLFDKKGKKLLKHSKNNKLTIVFSLDGSNKASHDRARGVQGSFNKIISVIDFINKSKYRQYIKISISSTLSEKNFNELPKIIELKKEHNFDSLSFYPARGMVGNNQAKITNNWESDIIKNAPNLMDLAKEVGLKTENIQRGIDTLSCNKESSYCFLPFFEAELDYDGNLFACCHALENRSTTNTSFGNVNKTKLSQVWKGKKSSEFRKKCLNVNFPFCNNCIYNYLNNKIAKLIKD